MYVLHVQVYGLPCFSFSHPSSLSLSLLTGCMGQINSNLGGTWECVSSSAERPYIQTMHHLPSVPLVSKSNYLIRSAPHLLWKPCYTQLNKCNVNVFMIKGIFWFQYKLSSVGNTYSVDHHKLTSSFYLSFSNNKNNKTKNANK